MLKVTFVTPGNIRRREDIQRYWFFDCKCDRCSDPTEFGTNMSAVLCFKCKRGYLLPTLSTEKRSDWICDKCCTLTKFELVDELITSIEDEVSITYLIVYPSYGKPYR